MIKKGVVVDIAILCNHLPGGLLPDRVLVHTGDRNEVVSFLLKQRKEKTIKQNVPFVHENGTFFVYLIQSEVIYLTVNRLTRIRVRCGQRIRN